MSLRSFGDVLIQNAIALTGLGQLRLALIGAVLPLAALLLCQTAAARNLVPNAGLETTVQCPTKFTQVGFVDFWHQATVGTPDYYHACSPDGSMVDVPLNAFGSQPSKDGDAYVGFFALFEPNVLHYREYVEVPLREELVAGQLYSVSFYASLADGSQYAIEELGAYLSETRIGGFTSQPLNLTPHISLGPGTPVADKAGWTEISGTYLAAGGERWLVIGNFRTDAQTVYQDVGADPMYPLGGDAAYYYVDAVSVRTPFDGVTLDFESLEHMDAVNQLSSILYLEDGYRIWPTLGAELYTYGTLHPFFSGSTAMNSQLDVTLTEATGDPVSGGPAFTLYSVDFTEGSDAVTENTSITVVGTKSDSSIVDETLFFDGIKYQPQTHYFDDFDDVVKVVIPEPTSIPRTQQFDDVRICQVGVGACSEPPPLEEQRYCISGASTGVGWSWQLSGAAVVSAPALPVGSPPGDLALAFVDSIQTSGPTESRAWIDWTNLWHCFEVAYTPGFELLVGPENGTPNCVVTGNVNGCSFNPTITDASFLPAFPGTDDPVAIVSVPTGAWPVATLLLGTCVAAASLALRLRQRRRADGLG